MIFGYADRTVNEFGLMALREVTFAVTPEALRLMARFLEQAAGMLEEGNRGSSEHYHIGTFHPEWSGLCPGDDVIIARN